jgi:hypothetical protein
MASPVKSKFNLSIGGFVKLDYAYNSVDLGPSGALLPNGSLPRVAFPQAGAAVQGNQEQSILTARQSRFWLKVAGPTFLGAKTGALIEADFYGDPSSASEAPQLRERLAYGTLDWENTQVLFGQAYDIFGPAIASTVDFRQGAATGTPNQPRVPQLRLTQKVSFNADNSLKLVVGVQDPNQLKNNNFNLQTASGTNPVAVTQNATTGITSYGTAVNVAGQIMFISKALGAAPGFYGLSMNNLTLGGFGLWGSQKVTSVTGAPFLATHAVDVYGYGVYAFVPVMKSKDGKNRAMTASLEAQGYIASGMNFNSATATATVTSPLNGAFGGTPTNISGAKGWGAYGQLIFYPTQDLGITGGYERRNALNYASYGIFTNPTTGLTTNAGTELYNELIYANVAYDLNAAVRVAVEYEHSRTQFAGIDSAVRAAGLGNFGQINVARVAAYYFF